MPFFPARQKQYVPSLERVAKEQAIGTAIRGFGGLIFGGAKHFWIDLPEANKERGLSILKLTSDLMGKSMEMAVAADTSAVANPAQFLSATTGRTTTYGTGAAPMAAYQKTKEKLAKLRSQEAIAEEGTKDLTRLAIEAGMTKESAKEYEALVAKSQKSISSVREQQSKYSPENQEDLMRRQKELYNTYRQASVAYASLAQSTWKWGTDMGYVTKEMQQGIGNQIKTIAGMAASLKKQMEKKIGVAGATKRNEEAEEFAAKPKGGPPTKDRQYSQRVTRDVERSMLFLPASWREEITNNGYSKLDERILGKLSETAAPEIAETFSVVEVTHNNRSYLYLESSMTPEEIEQAVVDGKLKIQPGFKDRDTDGENGVVYKLQKWAKANLKGQGRLRLDGRYGPGTYKAMKAYNIHSGEITGDVLRKIFGEGEKEQRIIRKRNGKIYEVTPGADTSGDAGQSLIKEEATPRPGAQPIAAYEGTTPRTTGSVDAGVTTVGLPRDVQVSPLSNEALYKGAYLSYNEARAALSNPQAGLASILVEADLGDYVGNPGRQAEIDLKGFERVLRDTGKYSPDHISAVVGALRENQAVAAGLIPASAPGIDVPAETLDLSEEGVRDYGIPGIREWLAGEGKWKGSDPVLNEAMAKIHGISKFPQAEFRADPTFETKKSRGRGSGILEKNRAGLIEIETQDRNIIRVGQQAPELDVNASRNFLDEMNKVILKKNADAGKSHQTRAELVEKIASVMAKNPGYKVASKDLSETDVDRSAKLMSFVITQDPALMSLFTKRLTENMSEPDIQEMKDNFQAALRQNLSKNKGLSAEFVIAARKTGDTEFSYISPDFHRKISERGDDGSYTYNDDYIRLWFSDKKNMDGVTNALTQMYSVSYRAFFDAVNKNTEFAEGLTRLSKQKPIRMWTPDMSDKVLKVWKRGRDNGLRTGKMSQLKGVDPTEVLLTIRRLARRFEADDPIQPHHYSKVTNQQYLSIGPKIARILMSSNAFDPKAEDQSLSAENYEQIYKVGQQDGLVSSSNMYGIYNQFFGKQKKR